MVVAARISTYEFLVVRNGCFVSSRVKAASAGTKRLVLNSMRYVVALGGGDGDPVLVLGVLDAAVAVGRALGAAYVRDDGGGLARVVAVVILAQRGEAERVGAGGGGRVHGRVAHAHVVGRGGAGLEGHLGLGTAILGGQPDARLVEDVHARHERARPGLHGDGVDVAQGAVEPEEVVVADGVDALLPLRAAGGERDGAREAVIRLGAVAGVLGAVGGGDGLAGAARPRDGARLAEAARVAVLVDARGLVALGARVGVARVLHGVGTGVDETGRAEQGGEREEQETGEGVSHG